MKLNKENISSISGAILAPTYNKGKLSEGIVHIGVGGFHRAHQAVYTDLALADDQGLNWGICGLGLREADKEMKTVLENQDFFYSLIELGYEDSKKVQIIGSINDYIFAPEAIEKAFSKLASAETRIVSLTITEGGYNVDDQTGKFDLSHPDIIHDLAHPNKPRTVFAYLTKALAMRRQNSIAPFTILSCDNLPHNGEVTRRALISFAEKVDVSLAQWIKTEVCFPNSMVDRITPQTRAEHGAWLSEEHGIDDLWPVVCEPFSQWVLEDKFSCGRPPWEKVGVTFTQNVKPYETVKIKLLNASHMAMCYLGALSGYRYTHEVVANPIFSKFIRDFMDYDVSPDLADITEIDIQLYKKNLFQRFSNRQIADQLSRLCLDGSNKMPKFIVPTIISAIKYGRSCDRLALIVAGWAQYLLGKDELGRAHHVDDPQAEMLVEAVQKRDQLSANFLGLKKIFTSEILPSNRFVDAFEIAVAKLERRGVSNTINELNKGRHG